MTIQERIDCGLIDSRFKTGYREGSTKELFEDYPFLEYYINILNHYGLNRKVAILKKIEEEKTYILLLYSNENSYGIVVKPHYIGCVMSKRYKEPLEDWYRGSDLPDGKCNEEKFKHILLYILSLELIPYDDGSKKPCNITEDEEQQVI